MCLRFQFCTHQRVCILYFLKKSQIRCTLLGMLCLLQNTVMAKFAYGASNVLHDTWHMIHVLAITEYIWHTFKSFFFIWRINLFKNIFFFWFYSPLGDVSAVSHLGQQCVGVFRDWTQDFWRFCTRHILVGWSRRYCTTL